MKPSMFRDMEGDLCKPGLVDKHHTVSRAKMCGKGERDFANLNGLVLPIKKIWHNMGKLSLHANVGLCPKPERQLMYMIREFIYEQDPEDNIYGRFFDISDYVHDVGENNRNIGLAINARNVAKNFDLQLPFIIKGMVVPIYEEVEHEGAHINI